MVKNEEPMTSVMAEVMGSSLQNFKTSQLCINTMITHVFISFSTVQICHLSYIHLTFFSVLNSPAEIACAQGAFTTKCELLTSL